MNYGPRTQSVRQVDFRNATYVLSKPKSWPNRLEWLSVAGSSRAKLVNGRWAVTPDEPAEPFSGLVFESVSFGDLIGDGREEAVVTLRFESGGTQNWHYVYIYAFDSGRAKLLGFFRSGDRAYFGIYRAYVKNGDLVTELFDPKKRMGDCCSSGFVRTRYRWHESKFEKVGSDEFGTPKTQSHLPVSAFGIHQ